MEVSDQLHIPGNFRPVDLPIQQQVAWIPVSTGCFEDEIYFLPLPGIQTNPRSPSQQASPNKGKGKGKFHPTTDHEGPEV
jgi:hypothetical protein